MGIFDIFKSSSKNQPSRDSVEFPEVKDVGVPHKMSIRIESVNGLADVERVGTYLKQGDVVFIKTKDLQKRDVGLFQTSLQKMKRLSTQFNWDMVALQEGYIILTPSFVRIERPDASVSSSRKY